MSKSKNAARKRGLSWNRHGWTGAIIRISVGAALAGFLVGVPHIRDVRAQTNRFVAVGGTDLGGTNDCTNPGQPCATIQNAVNHSAIGDLVQLGPGTYFENVTIFSSSGPADHLTFQGDLSTGSIVNGNNAGPVFAVGGSHTATFRNLTITNGNSGDATGSAGGGITSGGATTITVIGCTISGNKASGNFATAGGGIFNAGAGTLTVINSTISGNSADQGAAIQSQGPLTLINTTMAGNTAAPSSGGGIANFDTVNLTNTIIAGNTGGDFLEASGVIGTNDHNLVQDGSISGTLTGDPKLGPLKSNGGPTFTRALLAGSPAIDAGDDAVLGDPINLTTDQRGVGFPRKSCAHVDIGAYEANAGGPPIVTCPADISAMASPGQTTATVSFSATAADPCNGPLAPVYKIGNIVITSPHAFGVGVTTVTVSATDSAGLTASCSFTVTVTCPAPTITCPASISVYSDPGQTTATVSFAAAASDACDGALTPVYKVGTTVITSPFAFPPGLTTVTATATGSNGLTGSCSFTVTVTLLNVCIQDDRTGDTFRFNSMTGQYAYTRCKDKFTLTGTGSVRNVNGLNTLIDIRADRRLSAMFNPGAFNGRATIMLLVAQGVYQTIVVNQMNPSATCACP